MAKIQTFLNKGDYSLFIQDSVKDNVLRSDEGKLETAEAMAQQEIISYLAGRYDTDQIFMTIYDWNSTDQFLVDEYAVDSHVDGADTIYRVYKALQDNNNVKPNDNLGVEWAIEDPRNPLIVRYMCEISLYLAHQAINPNQIPKLRIDNYDLAIKWLEKVAAGKLDPKLPKPADEDDTSKDTVIYGSVTKRNNHF